VVNHQLCYFVEAAQSHMLNFIKSRMLNGKDVMLFHLSKLYSWHIWTALWQASNVKQGEYIRLANGSLQFF